MIAHLLAVVILKMVNVSQLVHQENLPIWIK